MRFNKEIVNELIISNLLSIVNTKEIWDEVAVEDKNSIIRILKNYTKIQAIKSMNKTPYYSGNKTINYDDNDEEEINDMLETLTLKK